MSLLLPQQGLVCTLYCRLIRELLHGQFSNTEYFVRKRTGPSSAYIYEGAFSLNSTKVQSALSYIPRVCTPTSMEYNREVEYRWIEGIPPIWH